MTDMPGSDPQPPVQPLDLHAEPSAIAAVQLWLNLRERFDVDDAAALFDAACHVPAPN